jgi:hypothetical protein
VVVVEVLEILLELDHQMDQLALAAAAVLELIHLLVHLVVLAY